MCSAGEYDSTNKVWAREMRQDVSTEWKEQPARAALKRHATSDFDGITIDKVCLPKKIG